MVFVFLGTGTPGGYPDFWCQCPNCVMARKRKGKNIRGESSAFLSPDILIDLPIGVSQQAARFGINGSKIRYLFITHSHGDHFCPGLILRRRKRLECDLTHRTINLPHRNLPKLRIFGSKGVIQKILAFDKEAEKNCQLSLNAVKPFCRYAADDLAIVPLLSSHPVPGEEPLNFIIQRKGKTILYALDTFKFFPETWSKIREFRFDLVVLEASEGKTTTPMKQFEIKAHLNLKEVEKIHNDFVREKLLCKGGVFALSHLSHYTEIYDEIAPDYAKKGITVAYDGMKIRL